MFVARNATPFDNEPWGLDNGAFSAWKRGEQFPADAFLRRVDFAHARGLSPYLAVCPDIVAGGMRSLEFSLGWRDRLKDVDWPWYLAVQDGMTLESVSAVVGKFAGLFLGGTNEFKSTAPQWVRLAQENEKKFHYARVSVLSKLELAFYSNADSCDSAFPLWTEDRMQAFIKRWQELAGKYDLGDAEDLAAIGQDGPE